MKRKYLLIALTSLLVAMSSCRSHYRLTDAKRTRILIDNRYDAQPDGEAAAFIAPYKHRVDSIMSPVMGETARYLSAERPESPLSNLLADILVWGGKDYNESPDLGVYNMGGIRAAFAKGKVTYGDVLDVAPFENKICFLSLKGDQLLALFQQMASRGGEGVSHGVNMVIDASGKLHSVKLHGKDIDPKATYRVATLDYLAEGNDGLLAFKNKTDVVSPKTKENNVRFIIMNYFREQASKGKAVDAAVEGRVIVK